MEKEEGRFYLNKEILSERAVQDWNKLFPGGNELPIFVGVPAEIG